MTRNIPSDYHTAQSTSLIPSAGLPILQLNVSGHIQQQHQLSQPCFYHPNCLAYRYRYGPKFYNQLPVFLEKAHTAGTNQNFIIRCWYFSCCYLFVSLWRFSHMSLSYLSSDGLIFLCFLFCRVLGLLLCLKSKKHKGSNSLPSLMGNYHKSYLHISAIMFG